MLDVLLIVLGLLISIAGLVGCVFPVIPGPPLSFTALILLSIAMEWVPFSTLFLVGMGALTVLVSVLDYVVPAAGAKKFGASKSGVWGAVIGMLVGLIFFPPLGMFIGAFIGAVVGEMASGKEGGSALRAGWGVFVGTVVATGIKLAASGIMLFYYIKALL